MRRLLAIVVCVLFVFVSSVKGQPRPDSPRLRQVLQDQKNHRLNLPLFWRQVKSQGTPLIEALPGDATHRLVTFLWRGTPRTRNVGMFATITRNPVEPMRRLAGTDVWFFSAKVPTGARFAYWLTENSPMVTEGPLLSRQLASLQADPLNSKRWGCADTTKLHGCQSAVEMPGAAAQPWAVRGDAPDGTLTPLRFQSARLGNERSVTVYRPHGYDDRQPAYNLLLVFDEGAYLSLVPTPVILDNLIAAGRIPPTVAVFIGNPSAETRTNELRANPTFVAALTEELLPWLHAQFDVAWDPAHVTLAGSSFGGLTAVFAALQRPDRFGNVLCQSGDFSWSPDHQHAMGRLADATTETGWLAKQFIASPLLPIRFYMDAGTFEADQFGTGGMILETSRHMRDVLLAKGYSVTYQQFVGGHDYLSWRGTFADGLLALVGK